MGVFGTLEGTWGLGRNVVWQILVRPTQLFPGRAGCGRSPNLADPMPEAWILALVRPTQKNVGRESSGNAGAEQILAAEGTFSTPTILPGSSRIWPRPDLARPWVPAKSGPGPILRVHSKMFFGHNLNYMAPFAIPRAGFRMCFSARIFCLFMPKDDVLNRGLTLLIRGQHVGLGTFFGSKMGPPKMDLR